MLGENFATPDGKHEITIDDVIQHNKTAFLTPWLMPNGEIQLDFTVCPRKFDYEEDINSEYNGIIQANLYYPNAFPSQDATNSDGVYIYSATTETGWVKSDKITVTKAWDSSRLIGYMNSDGSYTTYNCPVDVKILDAKGELLATVSTGSTDIIEIDGLVAFAIDDVKFIRVPQDKVSEFQILAEAADNGTMSVLTYDIKGDSVENLAVFADVPLFKGITFHTDMTDGTVRLFVSENGKSVSVIEPNVMIKDDTLTEWLLCKDLSDWELTATKSATTRGLATEELLTDFKANTTRAEFCHAAVNLIERYYGIPISTILEEHGLQAKKFADTDDPAIGAGVALGITAGTDAEKNLFSPNGELMREQAATMLKRTLDVIGAEVDSEAVVWTDSGDISNWASEAIGAIYSVGVMGGISTESLVFSPKTPYTHEQSIVTLNRLWDYLHK